MRLFGRLLGYGVFIAIILAGLEIGLRSFPELIPLTLLKRFHSELRLAIAEERSLWNMGQMVEIPRDDEGPALLVPKGGSRIAYDFGGSESGVMVMDDQGFCNPPQDSYERRQIDLIAIGDSFTWCVVLDAESGWSSQLGAITGLSVYSLGRGGIGPYDYLQILGHFGLKKDPKYVVMNFYEGNDVRDSDRYWQHVNAAREGQVLFTSAGDRSENELDYERLLGFPVIKRSYAINFSLAVFGKLYEGVVKALRRMQGGDVKEKVDFRYRLDFAGASMPFNVQNADESEVRYAHKLKRGEVDFSVVDGALAAFVALGKTHGFNPIVSYSPSAHTAYLDFVEFADESLTDLMAWFSETQRAYLAGKADELGFQFVDLTPAMQRAARELQDTELLYHPINVHYTVKGNRVAAEALARALTDDKGRPSVMPQPESTL
jgi:hypothetical protein